jgi:hypothetical protein
MTGGEAAAESLLPPFIDDATRAAIQRETAKMMDVRGFGPRGYLRMSMQPPHDGPGDTISLGDLAERYPHSVLARFLNAPEGLRSRAQLAQLQRSGWLIAIGDVGNAVIVIDARERRLVLDPSLLQLSQEQEQEQVRVQTRSIDLATLQQAVDFVAANDARAQGASTVAGADTVDALAATLLRGNADWSRMALGMEIAQRLGMRLSVVLDQLAAIEEQDGIRVPPRNRSRRALANDERRAIHSLLQETEPRLTYPRIAELVGVSVPTVQNVVDQDSGMLGLAPRRRSPAQARNTNAFAEPGPDEPLRQGRWYRLDIGATGTAARFMWLSPGMTKEDRSTLTGLFKTDPNQAGVLPQSQPVTDPSGLWIARAQSDVERQDGVRRHDFYPYGARPSIDVPQRTLTVPDGTEPEALLTSRSAGPTDAEPTKGVEGPQTYPFGLQYREAMPDQALERGRWFLTGQGDMSTNAEFSWFGPGMVPARDEPLATGIFDVDPNAQGVLPQSQPVRDPDGQWIARTPPHRLLRLGVQRYDFYPLGARPAIDAPQRMVVLGAGVSLGQFLADERRAASSTEEVD